MVTVAGITDAALGADWINHHSYSASPSLSIISVLITTLKCKMGLFTYIQIKTDFGRGSQLTPVLHLGAGACAGIIAMSATYPMDMVRGKITVQTEKSPYQYRGMFHALTTVLREEGPRSIVGLNFAIYESLKDWLVKSNPFGLVQDSELSVTTRLACGAAPGTVGQTVAYPL
ncbi:hypothetical protein HN51_069815 [Arachis hypogaea]